MNSVCAENDKAPTTTVIKGHKSKTIAVVEARPLTNKVAHVKTFFLNNQNLIMSPVQVDVDASLGTLSDALTPSQQATWYRSVPQTAVSARTRGW